MVHGSEVDNPSSGVHGVTGNIIGTSDSQTLTNKTFDDELTLQEIATPTSPSAGYKKIYPKSDGLLYTLDSAGNEIAVGTGGGGLDAFVTQDFETLSTSSFSSDNDSSYRGASGTFGGTLSDETTSPIAGAQSPKYTAGASSTDDWFEIETVDLDLKQRGEVVGVTLYADMSSFSYRS